MPKLNTGPILRPERVEWLICVYIYFFIIGPPSKEGRTATPSCRLTPSLS